MRLELMIILKTNKRMERQQKLLEMIMNITYKSIPSRSPQVGDWVRFYQGGKLVVGVVGYIRDANHYPWGSELCTDVGTVNISDVLEVK